MSVDDDERFLSEYQNGQHSDKELAQYVSDNGLREAYSSGAGEELVRINDKNQEMGFVEVSRPEDRPIDIIDRPMDNTNRSIDNTNRSIDTENFDRNRADNVENLDRERGYQRSYEASEDNIRQDRGEGVSSREQSFRDGGRDSQQQQQMQQQQAANNTRKMSTGAG